MSFDRAPLDCGQLDWNPVSAAQMHSALAGTLASLVFAGIVLLMTLPSKPQHSRNALRLLLGAFLILTLDSFLWGVVGGSQICAQAWTLTMLAAGLLGLGVLAVFAGLTWLIDQRDEPGKHTTLLCLSMVYLTALIVGINLWTTAHKYRQDLSSVVTYPDWFGPVIDAYPWVMFTAMGILCVNTAVRRFGRARPRVPEAAILTSAYAYMVCAFVSSYLTGQATLGSRADWDSPDPGLVVATTLVSLVIPAAAVLLQIFALPSARPGTPGGPSTGAPTAS